MSLLAAGVALFALCHLILAVPKATESLSRRFGRFYRPGFAVLSLVPLLLVVAGWRMAPFIAVYDPPSWGRLVTFTLVFLAFLCLGIFLFRGSWRRTLRFPMALAVIFWSLGHLFSNGDAASLVLFAGMLIYGALHLSLGLANGLQPAPIIRQGHDTLSVIAGAALYGLFAQLHPLITGVPVVTLTL
jgi:uncharacterized membrane protein